MLFSLFLNSTYKDSTAHKINMHHFLIDLTNLTCRLEGWDPTVRCRCMPKPKDRCLFTLDMFVSPVIGMLIQP